MSEMVAVRLSREDWKQVVDVLSASYVHLFLAAVIAKQAHLNTGGEERA